VTAWRPALLADRADLTPSTAKSIRAAERARQTILAADQHTPARWEPLARMLLRSEGVASSYIEGVTAPVDAVLLAQAVPGSASGAAAWVAANVDVLNQALTHAATDQPLTVADLHHWHWTLMHGHTVLPEHRVGAFRDEQGWIGGASPLDAALVTAPTGDVPALVDDVLAYLAIPAAEDPVTQAAVAHAQFEIIHPYADGNGRLGRLLILWTLARHTGVRVLPPLSVRIAADPGGYLSGLTTYRLSDAQPWIAVASSWRCKWVDGAASFGG
jgi:Fic family protein